MAEASLPSLDWLRKQLQEADPDLLRAMVESVVATLMGAEADALCGAAYGERHPERSNRRNGYRERAWDTRLGTIALPIPKLRHGSYFPEWLLEPRRRAERALVQVVAEAYLLGVSVRRIETLVQTLGIDRLSKSRVAEMARELDELVATFRTRPLDAGPYAYLWIDAQTQRCRDGGRVVNVATVTAIGVNAEGYREVLGCDVITTEDGAGWTAFLRDLAARGLSGVRLVVSDDHKGLKQAVAAVLTGASWQRCRTHFARNLLSRVPKSAQPLVATLVRSIFAQPSARRGLGPARPGRRAVAGSLHCGRRPAAHGCRGHSRLRRLPERALAPDLVQQPARASAPRDPQTHRRGRHLPQPCCGDPPGRRGPCRAARRLAGHPTLHGHGRPRQDLGR